MREQVLHYLWNYKKFKSYQFKSIDGQDITILNKGYYNSNSGPDFLNASILVNNVEWHGHIEFHINSSDWNKHEHQNDLNYENVILHMVYNCDEPVFTGSGVELIQVEVSKLIDANDIITATQFIEQKKKIACEGNIDNTIDFFIVHQKEKALINRLEERTSRILQETHETNYDWELITYRMLARAFGTNINKHAFEHLCQIIPLNQLIRNSNSILTTEAILFKASGLLENQNSYYAGELNAASIQYFIKYNVKPMDAVEWKFNRMRPHNFPTIRISQFANLVFNGRNLFSKIIDTESIEELTSILYSSASEYWDNHYSFNNPSPQIGSKICSNEFLHRLIINACVPILFAYGKIKNEEKYCDKAIHFLQKIKAEENIIVKKFRSAGFSCSTAYDSQALIEQYKSWCEPKKCLSCHVGTKIISKP